MKISKPQATAIGFLAVIMWSMLGVLTASSGNVPPFLLNGLCFTASGIIAILWIRLKNGSLKVLKQPLRIIAFGTIGLFGFHFFYFTSLRNAPPVEANLINYTWPLLIVLFSSLLPGEKLRWFHILGVLLGLIGAGLLLSEGLTQSADNRSVLGYSTAVLAALFWSSYSVISRRFANSPTEIVSIYCLFSGILSICCHLLFETTIWPQAISEWLAVVGLAAFPVGLAFFVWDYGVKRGDIQVLGASAYMAPLLSTVFLILFGFGDLTWLVGIACFLITLGAMIAAKNLFFGKADS